MSKARGLADLGNAYSDGALSNRNLIINSAMQVAQRGTSVTGVTGSGYFICDRWYFDRGGSSATYSLEQSSDAPEGFSYSFKATATTPLASPSATDARYITTRLEGQDLQQLNFAKSAAKKVTVSFWVKASTTGTACFSMYQDDGNLYYGKQYTIVAANTWEYKTVVVDLPTTGAAIANDNTTGLRIYFGIYAGSNYTSGSTETWGNITNWFVGQDNFSATTNSTFQITGVQLEVGDTATPFEHRSYSDEIQRCMRYYYAFQKAGDSASNNGLIAQSYNANSAYMPIQFPVEMRANPTFSMGGLWSTRLNNNNSFTASNPGIQIVSKVGGVFYSGVSSLPAATSCWVEPWSGDTNHTAYMNLNAEL